MDRDDESIADVAFNLNVALLAAAVVVHEHAGRCGCVRKADDPNLCSHCKLFWALLKVSRDEGAAIAKEVGATYER